MFLTIVRTPYNPEDDDAGFLRVSHRDLPRFKPHKGTKTREQVMADLYRRFAEFTLVEDYVMPSSYIDAVTDWLCQAKPGDNLILPPYGGCDGAVMVLHDGDREPTNYSVRQVPAFALINDDDELDDALAEEDDGEDEDEEAEEEDEDEKPRKIPVNGKARVIKKKKRK